MGSIPRKMPILPFVRPGHPSHPQKCHKKPARCETKSKNFEFRELGPLLGPQKRPVN